MSSLPGLWCYLVGPFCKLNGLWCVLDFTFILDLPLGTSVWFLTLQYGHMKTFVSWSWLDLRTGAWLLWLVSFSNLAIFMTWDHLYMGWRRIWAFIHFSHHLGEEQWEWRIWETLRRKKRRRDGWQRKVCVCSSREKKSGHWPSRTRSEWKVLQGSRAALDAECLWSLRPQGGWSWVYIHNELLKGWPMARPLCIL